MPGPTGGDSGSKITIDIEVRVKELEKQLGDAHKLITALDTKVSRRSRTRKKESKLELDETAKIKKAQIDLAKSYEKTTKAVSRKAKFWSFIRKDATKTGAELKSMFKMDVGKGFFGGLMQGSGAAGAYHAIRGRPGGPGFRQRLGGAIGRQAVGLGSQLLGGVVGGLQSAHQTYMQYGAAQWGMTGMSTGKADRGRLRGAVGKGIGMGFTPTETAQMAPGVAAATGALGATHTAQRFAMAGGYGPGRVGEAVNYMGTMRQAGTQFGVGGQDQKTLAKTISAGMYSGLEKARLPEFYEGVRGLVQSQFQTAAGKIDSVNIAKQLATLGKNGGVGFQGERGARIMGQLDQMIRSPGGGEAGQAIVMQAMGFGKPGGKVNYYDALKSQQEGIRDPDNIKKVMKEVYSQRGVVEAGGSDPRNREANLQFSMISGLSLKQTEQLKDIYSSSKSIAEQDKEAQKVLDESKDLQTQAVEATKDGFAGIKKHIAGTEAMMIQIGSRLAPLMMKYQTEQLNALNWISKQLPTVIKIAIDILKGLWETLKEIGIFIKSLWEKAWGPSAGEKMRDITKQYNKGEELILDKIARKTSRSDKKADELINEEFAAGGVQRSAAIKNYARLKEEGASPDALEEARYQMNKGAGMEQTARERMAQKEALNTVLKNYGIDKNNPDIGDIRRDIINARLPPGMSQQGRERAVGNIAQDRLLEISNQLEVANGQRDRAAALSKESLDVNKGVQAAVGDKTSSGIHK